MKKGVLLSMVLSLAVSTPALAATSSSSAASTGLHQPPATTRERAQGSALITQSPLPTSGVTVEERIRENDQAQEQARERLGASVSVMPIPTGVNDFPASSVPVASIVPAFGSQRSEQAQEHMSAVAKQVEVLLQNRTLNTGIGQQVREIAREQNGVQLQVKERMQKLEERKGWVKALIGPDYNTLQALEKDMVENQVRIREMEQLQQQLSANAGTAVDGLIAALNQEQADLREQLAAEQQTKSVFGWLFHWFAK